MVPRQQWLCCPSERPRGSEYPRNSTLSAGSIFLLCPCRVPPQWCYERTHMRFLSQTATCVCVCIMLHDCTGGPRSIRTPHAVCLILRHLRRGVEIVASQFYTGPTIKIIIPHTHCAGSNLFYLAKCRVVRRSKILRFCSMRI